MKTFRMRADLVTRIDRWAKRNGKDSHSEAMRHLLELGLRAPTADRLIAGTLEQLGFGLSRLGPERSGYITAEVFERLTGEGLDESSQGRTMMAELAARHRCTIQTPLIERRVYFTKAK